MTVIKFRRDTSTNWTSVNPIPAQGEPCYETDTGKLKIGNGSDSYTNLDYVSDGGSATIPIASSTTLGGIKVGDNLTIAADGTLSAQAGGTTDYTQLENKPQINSVELSGNKTLDDLGIQAKGDYQPAGDYATTADIPTKTSQLTNDSGFLTEAPVPDNMVTTNTVQEITGSKTFSSATVSDTLYLGNSLTFNGTSTAINSVNGVYGGWKSGSNLNLANNAVLTGKTGLQIGTDSGDIKISGGNSSGVVKIANGSESVDITSGAGGISLDASNGAISIFSDTTFKGGSGIKLNNIANSQTITTTTTSTGYLNIASTSSSLSTFLSMYDKGNNQLTIAPTYITTRTADGDTYNYINTQNIDTTYMKWSSGELTVDTAAIAHLAMPSNTTVSLTLGASGATYTAPADGYFSLTYTCNTADAAKVEVLESSDSSICSCYKPASIGGWIRQSWRITNGMANIVNYSGSSSSDTSRFKFVYCVGSVPSS